MSTFLKSLTADSKPEVCDPGVPIAAYYKLADAHLEKAFEAEFEAFHDIQLKRTAYSHFMDFANLAMFTISQHPDRDTESSADRKIQAALPNIINQMDECKLVLTNNFKAVVAATEAEAAAAATASEATAALVPAAIPAIAPVALAAATLADQNVRTETALVSCEVLATHETFQPIASLGGNLEAIFQRNCECAVQLPRAEGNAMAPLFVRKPAETHVVLTRFSQLPDELLLHVLQFLHAVDLALCSYACRRFYMMAETAARLGATAGPMALRWPMTKRWKMGGETSERWLELLWLRERCEDGCYQATSMKERLGGRVAAGGAHSLVIDRSGRLWGCGRAGAGQLGGGSDKRGVVGWSSQDNESFALQLVSADSSIPFMEIAAGQQHSIAVSAPKDGCRGGEVYTWGSGAQGCLGHGGSAGQPHPQHVQALAAVPMVHVSAAGQHCLCISAVGDVWSWGHGSAGQLGHPASTSTPVPQRVQAFGMNSDAAGLAVAVATSEWQSAVRNLCMLRCTRHPDKLIWSVDVSGRF